VATPPTYGERLFHLDGAAAHPALPLREARPGSWTTTALEVRHLHIQPIALDAFRSLFLRGVIGAPLPLGVASAYADGNTVVIVERRQWPSFCGLPCL
jgi:hypothetical protein